MYLAGPLSDAGSIFSNESSKSGSVVVISSFPTTTSTTSSSLVKLFSSSLVGCKPMPTSFSSMVSGGEGSAQLVHLLGMTRVRVHREVKEKDENFNRETNHFIYTALLIFGSFVIVVHNAFVAKQLPVVVANFQGGDCHFALGGALQVMNEDFGQKVGQPEAYSMQLTLCEHRQIVRGLLTPCL
jgi:hypothetical protein